MSGNSASFFSLDKVTFFTSINVLNFLLIIKKSNLVLVPNFISGFISEMFLNSLILLVFRAS